MKIGEVSKKTGVSSDRIRNYETEGLIDVYTDTKTGYRFYNEDQYSGN